MIRSIAIVLNGNVIAQVIAFLALPILSKIYSDQTFGAFQLYLSIIVVLMPFAALRLEFVLLNLNGSKRDLARILVMCIGINIIGALLLLAVLLVWPVSTIWPDAKGLPFPTWLLALGFVAFGVLQTFSTLAVRDSAFRLVAKARVGQTLSFNLLAIATGMVFSGVLPMLLSDIVSRIGTSLLFIRNLGLASIGRVDRSDLRWMREIILRYRHYPLFSVPSGVLSGITMGLPVIALFTLFPIDEVGQFSMAWRVTLLPVGVFAFSVSQVVNGRIAAIRREGEKPIRPQIVRISIYLLLIGLLAGALVFVLSEPATALVLGDDWRLAGALIALLAPMVVSTLAVAPLNTALTLLGHQRAQALWDLTRLAALICVFVWSGQSGADLMTTVRIYTWAAIFFSFVYWIILLALCDRSDRGTAYRQPTGEA